MSRRRFVYFDLGNVLINFEHRTAINRLARLAGKNDRAVRSAVFDSGLQQRYETGTVDGSQFAAEVNRRLGTELPRAEILESISDMFWLNQPVLEVLEHVRSAGLAMGILSNTCEAHWEWIVRQQWVLPGDFFQEKVLSYRVGSMKPDERIYEHCESLVGCDRADIFFTDDLAENVAAAARRGWTTYQFQSPEELLARLRAWLDD